MIKLAAKNLCSGCSACEQVCPKKCIYMLEDEEGFLHPSINYEFCIDCKLCTKVCPVINIHEARHVINTYAAKNNDENIRDKSSSGGMFTLFAKYVIEQRGVVFGAGFDDNCEVVHLYVDTALDLFKFRGSKYVQSKIGNTYKQAENFLKQGRLVLYSGTPCQISGLKMYLRKEYDNLFTIDFICHGVPSPKVWRLYIEELLSEKLIGDKKIIYSRNNIIGVEFRNKSLGWRNYSLVLDVDSSTDKNSVIKFSESRYDNVFLKGFLRNLYLRPSCHACSSKSFNSGSDISIADFWAINKYMPSLDDDKGYSLVMICSKAGQILYENIEGFFSIQIRENNIWKLNRTAHFSTKAHVNRNKFMDVFSKNDISIIKTISKYATLPMKLQMKNFTISILKNVGLLNYIIKRKRK